MGRFILTENYKRYINGRIGSTSSNYGIDEVNDLTDTSEDNWIVKDVDGTKYMIVRSAQAATGWAPEVMSHEIARVINLKGCSYGNFHFGTGGANADKDSYTINQVATATGFLYQNAPSKTLCVVTYTNTTSSDVSFDQLHLIKRLSVVAGTSPSGSASQKDVLMWIYDFGETITVAPSETVTFTIKIA